ncbi:hypothetical protein GJAV_G00010120 [Gymnothorax javanicus]|nr:hypothetical protein GJAV_G00010120 [Gymnothorax javanicus]
MALWLKVVTVMLFMYQPENLAQGTPCAEIQVQAPVAVLGSSFNASCLILEDCSLVQGRSFHIKWRLNGRVLAGHSPANRSGSFSTITVSGFSDVRATLECLVCLEEQCRIVEGVIVERIDPLSAPQNLTCLTNLTSPWTLTCKWDPGVDTHLPTNYTLHTEISSQERRAYLLPVGQHTYTIPREGFSLYGEMRISVVAQNDLGTVSSEPLLLVPLEAAKFDPPVLVDVRAEPNFFRCLSLRWRLSDQQQWMIEDLAVEVRFRPTYSDKWTTETKDIFKDDIEDMVLQQCGLLHGVDYQVQTRVRHGPGPWSEWSNSKTGTTLEKAPTGQLDVWLKVLAEKSETHNYVELFWMPLRQFQANGKNVSFHVFLASSLRRGPQKTVCRTQQRRCVVTLPKKTRKIYIAALNSAGQSSPIGVPVYQKWDMQPVSNVTISSAGNTSLQVSWVPPVSVVTMGYAVEWGPELQKDPSFLSFDLLGPNDTALLISAGIEPYMPYWVSVYARYQDGVGLPRTAQGYSLQKTPSEAPRIRVGEIQATWAQLSWEHIPLEQQHGIIRNYTVYCTDDAERTEVVSIGPTDSTVTLIHLSPMSQYKVFISASTDAGTVNGTVVTLKTARPNARIDVFAVVFSAVLIFCMILTALACFTKNDRLKTHFWPMIPDPANSSISTWTQGGILLDCSAFQNMKEIQDPVPVHLSWFSLLDVPEKQPEKGGSGGPNMGELWMQEGDFTSLGEPPKYASQDTEPAREVIPYATVVFANPYLRQACGPTSTDYVRSDSTQPLLGEESPGPGAYQNFQFHERGAVIETVQNQGVSGAFWEEFPLLSVLSMREAQSEG